MRDPSLKKEIILQTFAFLVSDKHSFSHQTLSESNIQPKLVLGHDQEMKSVALPRCDGMN